MPSFNTENDVLKEHLSGFQDSFTDEQKKAILFSLFDIANSDDEFHAKEIEFFDQIGNLLNYPTGESILDEYLEADKEKVFESLNDFSDSQKDWYIVIVYGMVHADGKVLDEELADAERFLEGMGISKERINDAIQKSPLSN
jgi:hypothetical protein